MYTHENTRESVCDMVPNGWRTRLDLHLNYTYTHENTQSYVHTHANAQIYVYTRESRGSSNTAKKQTSHL